MKVKNIMFSGFAAAILMGVATEANAVPNVVASKGYVDAITGPLTGLTGAAFEKENLVQAVNVKQDKLTAGANITIENGTISATDTNTTYEGEGYITVDGNKIKTTLKGGTNVTIGEDGSINATGLQKALIAGDFINIAEDGTITTKYSGGDNVTIGADGSINAKDTTYEGEGYITVDGNKIKTSLKGGTNVTIGEDGSINATDTNTTYEGEGYITVDGNKIKTTLKEGTNVTIGEDGSINATGLQKALIAGDFINIAEDGTITTKYSGGDNVTIGADGSINAKDTTYEGEGYITVDGNKIKTTLKEGTNVTIAEDGSINTTFPAMPTACGDAGVVCVLTSENNQLVWAILAQPHAVTQGTINDANRIAASGWVAQQQVIPDAQ